ncbi:MAG: urea amidolyase associated protein UAAP1 [Steroidobacteraceae bacterium]
MKDSATADPKRAREHARAMAGLQAEAMPTVPASSATDLPDGVAAGNMLWEETVASGGYASKELGRGARLRLIDLHGDGCVSMLVFNAERPVERLNVADTLKVQWSAQLRAGRLLLSDMGRVLFSILEDGAQTHDAFCGPSNSRTNARKFGDGANWGEKPSARDRLILGAAKFGLGAKDVHPCINWFKLVQIAPDGTTMLHAGPFSPGRSLTLRAEMNVIVVLANCPHVLDTRPDYAVTPVRLSAWRGPIAGGDDEVRNATPEALRAFLNVEEYFHR